MNSFRGYYDCVPRTEEHPLYLTQQEKNTFQFIRWCIEFLRNLSHLAMKYFLRITRKPMLGTF